MNASSTSAYSSGRVPRLGKASDWLREERRKVLGDWVAFCLGCGAARRWFDDFEADVPEQCPQCGGVMLRRCPSCNAPFSSIFAVDCESCGTQLRDPELFGAKIRRRWRIWLKRITVTVASGVTSRL